MTGWLDGKRTLVVGAGSGIGRAVVDAFRGEGAKVAVLERDPGKCAALREQLPDVPLIEGDAVRRDANDAAVAAAVAAFGGLDTLVHCVGVFDFYRGVAEIDAGDLPAAFDEMMRTNVLSALQSVTAAVPALQAGSGSSIVLTASASSFHPGRGGVLYVASKFAVRGLVAALADELAPAIRVNAVAPGGTVHTDLRGLESLGLGDTRLDATGRADDLAARTPLHVALSGADHAHSYVFFASDRSRGITGDFAHPDGGFGIGARG